jgi:hypothetical protein
LNLKGSEDSETLTSNDKALQASCEKDESSSDRKDGSDSEASALQSADRICTGQLGQLVLEPTPHPIAQIPVFTPNSQNPVETFRRNVSTDFNFAPPVLQELQPKAVVGVEAGFTRDSLSSVPARTTTDKGNVLAQFPTRDEPTTVLPAFVPSPPAVAPTLSSAEYNRTAQFAFGDKPTTVIPARVTSLPAIAPTLSSAEYARTAQLAFEDKPTTLLPAFALSPTKEAPTLSSVGRNGQAQLALGDKPTLVAQASAPSPTATEPAPYKGPGAASLLGGNIQAQASVEAQQESQSQNAIETNNPLAPSLVFQGGFITQGGTGARARVSGLYPISPNALFGGTVDLTTGEGFSDSEGTGLDLNELYFTGSLPSYPNLRLTVGLMDLTSYFDRNSFAKDSLTHFFNPVFQTNPALAAAGIGSRPGALLNWDVTDNIQARAAAFSSSRDIGDFDIDAFAGELAFRFGNAIVRGTFASDRDAGRNNGFEEIYGIPRDNGDFGIDSDDRENAYGINAEYFIPQINMGLFGRYGHYENTSLGEGGDTYSVGLNFLDLFMRDDRLGFGYGRNLSNNDLRRDNGNKVPDVWELFYDFRVTPYLRAGVSLQARDEFSDVVAGFRVRTDFDLLRIGRLFR